VAVISIVGGVVSAAAETVSTGARKQLAAVTAWSEGRRRQRKRDTGDFMWMEVNGD
jgi:hypothetical protein